MEKTKNVTIKCLFLKYYLYFCNKKIDENGEN